MKRKMEKCRPKAIASDPTFADDTTECNAILETQSCKDNAKCLVQHANHACKDPVDPESDSMPLTPKYSTDSLDNNKCLAQCIDGYAGTASVGFAEAKAFACTKHDTDPVFSLQQLFVCEKVVCDV